MEVTRLARWSCLSSLLTVGAAIRVRSASAVAVCTRWGSPASVAEDNGSVVCEPGLCAALDWVAESLN